MLFTHKNGLELGHSQNNRSLRLEIEGLLFQKVPNNITPPIKFNIFFTFKMVFTMIPDKNPQGTCLGITIKKSYKTIT
jgi:hypothetical protein